MISSIFEKLYELSLRSETSIYLEEPKSEKSISDSIARIKEEFGISLPEEYLVFFSLTPVGQVKFPRLWPG